MAPGRLTAWLRDHRGAVGAGLLVAALAALLALILGASLGRVRYGVRLDEGYYLGYVRQVHARGLGAYPEVYREWLGDPRHATFPPPYRVAFVTSASAVAAVLGPRLRSLSWLSVLSHLALVVTSFVFLRRLVTAPAALAATALLGCSPLLLGLSRRAFSDSFALLWTSLAVWLFFRVTEEPRRRLPAVGFAIAFTVAILAKETAVLLVVPWLGYALLARYVRGGALGPLQAGALLAVPLVLAGVVTIISAGGVAPLWAVVRLVLSTPATNQYATEFCAGPWYRYVVDLVVLSAGPTLLGIGYLGVLLLRPRAAWTSVSLYLVVMLVGLCLVYAPFIKNVRYVVLLEVPLRVFAALLVVEWIQARGARWATMLGAAAVLALCALDLRSFDDIFVTGGLYDTVSYGLLQARSIIPSP